MKNKKLIYAVEAIDHYHEFVEKNNIENHGHNLIICNNENICDLYTIILEKHKNVKFFKKQYRYVSEYSIEEKYKITMFDKTRHTNELMGRLFDCIVVINGVTSTEVLHEILSKQFYSKILFV